MFLEEIKRKGLRSRILTEIRLDAIAAVDKPCQEHATMALLKFAPREQPEALTRLAARGYDIAKLSAAEREVLTTNYDGGKTVIVKSRGTGFAYRIKKGEDTERWELGANGELIVPAAPVAKISRASDDGSGRSSYSNPVASGGAIQPTKPKDDEDEGEDDMYDFMDAVAKIAKRDGLSQTQALARARLRHPELFKAYQGETPAPRSGHPSTQRVEKSVAVVKFEDRVADIAKSRSLPWTRAADVARKEYPNEFAAAYR